MKFPIGFPDQNARILYLKHQLQVSGINIHSEREISVTKVCADCYMADSRSLQQVFNIQELASPISNNCSKQPSYSMLQGVISSSCPSNIIASSPVDFFKDNPGTYDLGEIDQALLSYLEGEPSGLTQKQCSGGNRSRPTLNMFPSKPMHASPQALSRATSVSGAESFDSQSIQQTNTNSSYKRAPQQREFESPSSAKKSEVMQMPGMGRNDLINNPATEKFNELEKDVKHEVNRRGPTSSSEPEGTKTPDAKTLRRLAQNREAARKSRLRKKAYVQQLETSRLKLAQLEQELQRARTQGAFMGSNGFLNDQGHLGNAASNGSLNSAAAFDMEYQRWLEEHHRHMCDLRAALQQHLPDNDLRVFVDNCVAHYDDLLQIKMIGAKADVFYVVSGMWKTPAERCFMWMGGFRPSELLKILMPYIEPLTEQQYQCICSLQQNSLQAEEALSQGMEELQHSLTETIAAGSLSSPSNMANYVGQMAMAMGKLANLEILVRQADGLRQQTLQQLHRILTTRQSAKCFLAIGEYFSRLRALSSFWSARPRE